MAIGDTTNPNLFGTDYNAGEEERKRLEAEASLAAQNARIGSGEAQAPVTFLPYADDVSTPRASALSVFTPGGEVKPGMDVNAITQSPEMTSPSAVNTALNQEVAVGPTSNEPGFLYNTFVNAPVKADQIATEFMSNLGNKISTGYDDLLGSAMRNLTPTEELGYTPEPFGKTFTDTFAITKPDGTKFYPDAVEPDATSTQGQQGTPSVDQVLQDGAGSFQPGGVDFSKPSTIKPPTMPEAPKLGPELKIRQGEEGSPQGYFNAITDERPLTPEEIKLGKAFADRKGFDFNPQTGFSVIDNPGARVFDTPATLENFQARGLDVGQFMRYEDDPSQRTEQFVDEQGRLRRRLTRDAATLQEFSPERIAQDRPLAPEFAQAEATGDQMIADLRAKEAAEAKGREGKMSYTDAKRRARGEFAAKNIDPSPSQLRKLAKGIQAAEPERLEGLETERALKEARIKTEEAELNKPEFKGKVYTVDGVTFAQLSNGSAQVISTGTEDPEKTTREAQKFEFTKKKIEDARKAYEEGDLTKSNDILAAANIQQYGIQANATQYFADSTPQVTPPAPQVTGSGLTQQQEARINLVMGTNPTRSRAEVIEAMQKEGKL